MYPKSIPEKNPLQDSDRKDLIINYNQGQRLELRTVIKFKRWNDAENLNDLGSCTEVIATPDNSYAKFYLSDERFVEPFWCGEWNIGIDQLDPKRGVCRITVPDEISFHLRRGSFPFSLAVKDRLTGQISWILSGSILVEYQIGSPNPEIPYKNPEIPYDTYPTDGGRDLIV